MNGLCLKTGIHGMAPAIPVVGVPEARANNVSQVSAVSRDKTSAVASAAVPPPQKTAWRFSFLYPLQSLWRHGGGRSGRYNGIAVDDAVLVENRNGNAGGREEGRAMGPSERRNGNWVLKILHVDSLWKEVVEEERGSSVGDEASNEERCKDAANDDNEQQEEEEEQMKEEEEEEERCDACKVEEEEDKGIEFDRESFSRLLRRVPLAEAKLYAQMSYLGSLAYCIPKIKPGNFLKYRGLCFVTSSVERRELAMKAEKISTEEKEPEEMIIKEEAAEGKEQKNSGNPVSSSAAYQTAASTASYLHSHTKSILRFKPSNAKAVNDSSECVSGSNEDDNIMDREVASLMATTDSVTAVVAANEEVKQAVADDLSSTRSSPCEWFICDDDKGTRFFVIQGSESMASWQANLLFEPVQFEGLDVPVHRGIYEAAKGLYDQMLPEVRSHLKSCGRQATFRFTGHSLGGSLSLLVNLMLLVRGEVPAASLLPVITFGAPSIMCGGDYLLHKLGLPRSHVQAIAMHRDIVPRAFSCTYPKHIAELLKAVNGNFRSHPCLTNQKLLYAPMGEMLILQPDEKFSPHHPLLPLGAGLYCLSGTLSDSSDTEKHLQAAQTVFLNSPHPLETLSDRLAYGSEGTIQRDHDMNSYLQSVRNVIRQELNRIRRSRREHRRKFWWSILAPHGNNGSVVVGRQMASTDIGQNQFNFSGALQTGRESLKRFNRFVASQHMHLFVVLLFPARFLLLGAYSVIGFH